MLPYNPGLKPPARVLRRTMTDAERLLWSRVRGKQIGPVQFYSFQEKFFGVILHMLVLSHHKSRRGA
jgi:very-short-patch-repair endonuclease